VFVPLGSCSALAASACGLPAPPIMGGLVGEPYMVLAVWLAGFRVCTAEAKIFCTRIANRPAAGFVGELQNVASRTGRWQLNLTQGRWFRLVYWININIRVHFQRIRAGGSK